MVRVLFAGDRRVCHSGMKSALADAHDIDVTGEITRLSELPREIDQSQPDVVVLDVAVVDAETLQRVAELRGKEHAPQIAAIMTDGQSEFAHALQRVGVHGYLLRYEDPTLLIEAVRAVAQGKTWFSPEVTRWLDADQVTLPPREPRELLNERDLKMLRLIAQDKTNLQIASLLNISPKTVDGELRSIYAKLGVRSRTGAVAVAIKLRLI